MSVPKRRSPSPYVTQKDIARLANVSQSAVAAALGRTDKIQVSEETRQKVLRAAAQLHYTPNQSASVTRSGRSGQVAVLVRGSMMRNAFIRVQELSKHLNEHGLRVSAHELQWTDRPLEEAWDEVLGARAEGIVLCSSFGRIQPEMHRRILNSPVPVVSLCGPMLPGISFVAPDFRKAFSKLTSRIIENGAKDLVFLKRFRHPDPITQIEWKRADREAGFLDAMTEARLPTTNTVFSLLNDTPLVPKTEFELGAQGFNDMLRERNGVMPQAIVCVNDNIATGVMTAAMRQHKVAIPERMWISGCDNEIWSAHSALPLTSIKHPTEAMALKVSELLIKLMNNDAEPEQHHHLPCEVVWRDSCPDAPFCQAP